MPLSLVRKLQNSYLMRKSSFLSIPLDTKWLITALTFLAGFLHFYNLNWGAPYYFHPDERNIASAVTQLSFPDQMNPNFFAYGSLPIYAIYFAGFLSQGFQIPQIDFSTAIYISRWYSAFFATLLIPLIFFIGKRLKDETTGIFAAALTAFSTGIIQFSHFGTFELWLTFFTCIFFFLCLHLLKKRGSLLLILFSLTLGVLAATKISHLVLLPVALLVILVSELRNDKNKSIAHKIGQTLLSSIIIISLSFTVYALTNPFVFIDTESFKNSMEYESSVVLGTLPVFYTGEFFNTTPVIFQLTSIYPFLLNPAVEILFIISFFLLLFFSIRKKRLDYILLLLFFLILFLSQALLFAKWTRYMVPTLPFIYLLIALFIDENRQKKLTIYLQIGKITAMTASIIFSLSYFITTYIETSPWMKGAEFAKANVSIDSHVITEVYDLGTMIFNDTHHNVEQYNFYDLDTPHSGLTFDSLQQKLSTADYIILPSQRILKSRFANPDKFPNGYAFYKSLLDGTLGYTKIYETPCSIFCKITYLNDPVFRFEQTANVFDKPTLFIYKKAIHEN